MRQRVRLLWPVAALFSLVGSRIGAASDSADRVNLVFDGDSISAGWGASRRRGLDRRVAAVLGGGVRLRNVAAGGRPVSDCLALYPRLVAPLFDAITSHNVIVFHAGDNDVSQGRGAVQTYTAFTAYVAAAHQQGWKVIVSTELRRRDFGPGCSAELEQYNQKLRLNSAAADAVVDFDTDVRMTDMSFRSDPTVFSRDGIHPSNGGYAVLGEILAPVVKRLAGR